MSVEALRVAEDEGPGEGPGVSIQELLTVLLESDGSDLHLTAGTPPVIRLHGDLNRLANYPVLEPQRLRTMIYSVISQKQRERLEQNLELDCSYSLPGKARFRLNRHRQLPSRFAK